MSRWPALRSTANPVIVDLGYGASAVTPVEFIERLRKVRPDARLVGIEIDPERVAQARAELPHLSEQGRSTYDVEFRLGGFETPLPQNEQAAVIRAFNVLRQYDETDVPRAWQLMLEKLQPDGVLVEGTCDEIGRVSTWVALTTHGPRTLTVSLRLNDLELPSIAAERLPKVLIHRNVPGERIHDFFVELDRAWQHQASLSSFGAEQRWIAAVHAMKSAGWPVRDGRTQWRLGEITVDWSAVAPAG